MQKKIFSREISLFPQVSLILANLVPIFGVVFFGWDFRTLLAIYWAESGVVGFYAILRMWKSEKEVNVGELEADTTPNPLFKISLPFFKFGLTLFFILHFGGFMIAHGKFLLLIFSKEVESIQINLWAVVTAILFLFVSHGISFVKNFIEKEEYKDYPLLEFMILPYKRITLMHLVILTAMAGIFFLGSFNVPALLAMVVLKVVFDLRAHAQEHSKW